MTDIDFTQDRHADPARALNIIFQNEEFPGEAVESIQVDFLASGDVTYRVYQKGAEEPVSGYYTEEELSD